MKTQDIDLVKLVDTFGTEDECHAYLEELRWPDGIACPRCESQAISRIKKRRQFDCDSCRYQFSVRVGTIFHDSHLPLRKWFLAIYIMNESKKGVSANQLKRMLKVSYKTAWYLCHRIRAAMKDEAPEPLRGIVEVDETFIGHRKTRGGNDAQSCIVGAVERDGGVRVAVVPNRRKQTLHGFIERHVHDDAEAIFTDEHLSYQGIGDENTRHETVQHSGLHKEWVNGQVHTNTVEGVWSLFKRSVVGSYHKLSVKHLPAYLDEMAWRYNNRDNVFMFRDTLLRLIGSEHLPYRQLISPGHPLR